MYQASVPVFIKMMQNLIDILKKAEVYAETRKIDPSVLINSRLFPDMLPLRKQVQIATDHAKGCAARLAGMEPPVYEDNEATFPELIGRLVKTIEYLKTLKEEPMVGSEDRTISFLHHGKMESYQGLPYMLHRSLPNFYFHVTTAYDILRHNGLEIGKADFIGKV
jgi:hypothetical protein